MAGRLPQWSGVGRQIRQANPSRNTTQESIREHWREDQLHSSTELARTSSAPDCLRPTIAVLVRDQTLTTASRETILCVHLSSLSTITKGRMVDFSAEGRPA